MSSSTDPYRWNLDQLFVGPKDHEFFNNISNQMLESIAGQYVFYLEVDPQRTPTNVYGEAREKVFKAKKKIVCRIIYEEPDDITDEYNERVDKRISIDFSKDLLSRQSIEIRQGDYIETIDGSLYEITSKKDWQPTYGDSNKNFMIKCTGKLVE